MTISVRSVLTQMIADLSDQTRDALTSTERVAQADMERFIGQCKILLKAFEEAAQLGEASSARRTYAIRILGLDVEAEYENAKTYIARLEMLHGPRFA